MAKINRWGRPLALLFAALCLWPAKPAYGLNISWQATPFTNTNILNETNLPNATTINFNIDTPGNVQITVTKVQNFGDTGVQVASLNQTFSGTGNQSMGWNGLWLMNGDYGRLVGNYQFALTLSTTSGSATAIAQSQLVQINSVDIHTLSVSPSFDAEGNPTFPYVTTYALAKDANVTATITSASGTVVRTLLTNAARLGEATVSSNTVTWDGLDATGKAAPIGLYTITLGATDPASGDQATPRSKTISVLSLAGSASNPQKLFEDNVYVYPNPVRNGSALFNVLPVREGAKIHLRIYTIAGGLVFDQDITSQLPFPWNVTNQAGSKVGRGLYYYVMREDDSQGTLQTTKKMVVLP